MAKIDPNFEFDMYRFLHLPLRKEDEKNDNFLERYTLGMQNVWEEINGKLFGLTYLNNPSKIRSDALTYLKDIVGFTKELDYVTNDLSETDLRKVILLGVPLWKTKGTELGFKTIIKLFTGFDARVFTWFDYRMIIGEKAIGEEQLGEDSWLISLPGIIEKSTTGNAFLLIQFDDKTVRDGSAYQNNTAMHGEVVFEAGGPIGQSDYYPIGSDWCVRTPYRNIFQYAEGITFESYFKTDNSSQTIPLIYDWDSNGKGIKLYLDTSSDEFTFTYSDGFITQTATWAAGISTADDTWHHVAWSVDWKADQPLVAGASAIWVDGTSIGSLAVNSSLNPAEVRSLDPKLVGSEDEYSTRYDGALDMVRLTGDVRYDVDNASITPPGVKFIEYQREELDEFQIDIRVVDDGTLDRRQLKRIINLMRPVCERINIAYIDFYDEFEAGKGKFATKSGTAYVEQFENVYYMKMPGDSLEHVEVTGSTEWTNYIVQARANIYSGKEFEVRWLIQDEDNYYAFRVNAETKLGSLDVCVAGVRTPLATPQPIDIEIADPDLYYSFYIFTVSCFKDEDGANTTVRAFVDFNQIFEVDDINFDTGTFGLYSPVGSVCWCSEVEMFQLPLETEKIKPNDKF